MFFAVIHGYFHGNVTGERVDAILRMVEEEGKVNRDFRPRLMSLVLREWFSEHGTTPAYFMLALLAAMLLYSAFIRRDEYILFSTGLTVMGMEMAIVFAFQAVYGYVYVKIGAIAVLYQKRLSFSPLTQACSCSGLKCSMELSTL